MDLLARKIKQILQQTPLSYLEKLQTIPNAFEFSHLTDHILDNILKSHSHLVHMSNSFTGKDPKDRAALVLSDEISLDIH